MLVTLVSAQPRGRQPLGGPLDSIEVLRSGIEEAGAAALSSEQEKQIQAVIDSIRHTLASRQPDEALGQALSAYREAVIAGNLATAKSAAADLAAKEAENSRTRLEEQADWTIQLLALLTPDQMNQLIAQFDKEGTFQLLHRVIRRPTGGPGFPGGPGMGPMGRRPRE